eukprot:2681549-Amphidinium_carterae.1
MSSNTTHCRTFNSMTPSPSPFALKNIGTTQVPTLKRESCKYGECQVLLKNDLIHSTKSIEAGRLR